MRDCIVICYLKDYKIVNDTDSCNILRCHVFEFSFGFSISVDCIAVRHFHNFGAPETQKFQLCLFSVFYLKSNVLFYDKYSYNK